MPLIYLNQLGGQDEVVYDGASFVLNADGAIAVALRSWRMQSPSPNGRAMRGGKWVCAPGENSRPRIAPPRSITP